MLFTFPLVLAPPPSTLPGPPNPTEFWSSEATFVKFKGSQTPSKSRMSLWLRPIFAGDRGCRDVKWVRVSKSAMDVKTRVSESRLLARANIQTAARSKLYLIQSWIFTPASLSTAEGVAAQIMWLRAPKYQFSHLWRGYLST